ncbi:MULTISPECIES: hypothetical protein [Bradyrhizobium]|uniref:hypothetical protein n=1 Tax=Bradyrhizobium TaxID=374 RepID=UPI000C1FB8DD|nr:MULTISPECIES: hypothetical protein [Bradyrhizobium]MCP1975516.1 hypothetical protein [Bradyrhizobium elkanii]MCS3482280.1 hypothetical protein [Bradyrhizobium elkanii]MCS3525033.1 hypothetical protein [Bradyrhizobium elkanii]MCS4075754.1 hypothetical protein [Bradyrhizobium elkanii]MCS4084995.1 hypothetical protein [Bradyrhizobium elkanii]
MSQDPDQIDAEARLFLGHLFAQAPELATAAELAKRFVSLLSGSDIAGLDEWITQAGELKSFANGIARDIDAVRAAITTAWTTSPVEGQISRDQSHQTTNVWPGKLPATASTRPPGCLRTTGQPIQPQSLKLHQICGRTQSG